MAPSPEVPPAPTYTLSAGPTFPRMGFGAMRLTGQPGNFGPYRDVEAGARLLRRAYDLGVRLIDTARSYGPGYNEELIASALSPYPDDLVIATKVGVEKPDADTIYRDGSPEALRRGVQESLARLEAERIPLVYLHRVDDDVPIEESVGALEEMRREGVIGHLGLSNVTAEEISRAESVAPVAAVQNRYGILERADDSLVDRLAEAGVAYVPYGPLGANPMAPGAAVTSDAVLARIGARHGATAAQVALASLLSRAPNVCPIPGTTSEAHLVENVASSRIVLTADDHVEIARLV